MTTIRMRPEIRQLVLLLTLVAPAMALAETSEKFFEAAAWNDSPTAIEAKFPKMEVTECAEPQRLTFADRAVGCPTHKILGYRLGEIDFIASFYFMKVDQSLAEISLFTLEPYSGETIGLKRLCETAQLSIGRQYGSTNLLAKESAEGGHNGVAAYSAIWETPKRRSKFELDCVPMEGKQMVISIVIRPIEPLNRLKGVRDPEKLIPH